MTPEIKDLWVLSQRSSNLKTAESYLESRGLSLFSDVGYVSLAQYQDRLLSDSLLFFVRDCIGEIVCVERREISKKEYVKLWVDSNSIPIYNVRSALDSSAVVITESILDAEVINQLLKDKVVAVSLLGASYNSAKGYFLGSIFKNKTVYFAFDNDESGVKGARAYIDFLNSKFQGVNVLCLDFPSKDLNAFLVKRGSGFVKEYIESQFI